MLEFPYCTRPLRRSTVWCAAAFHRSSWSRLLSMVRAFTWLMLKSGKCRSQNSWVKSGPLKLRMNCFYVGSRGPLACKYIEEVRHKWVHGSTGQLTKSGTNGSMGQQVIRSTCQRDRWHLCVRHVCVRQIPAAEHLCEWCPTPQSLSMCVSGMCL